MQIQLREYKMQSMKQKPPSIYKNSSYGSDLDTFISPEIEKVLV